MSHPFSDNQQVELVSTFSELVTTHFHDVVNAICWERKLDGDFQEIVSKLTLKENITEVSAEDLAALELSEKGQIARAIILQDLQLLSNHGALPSLNLLKNYERDDELDFISTDVYSYHVHRSPIASSTFLCTYFGAASDILPNDQAVQKVLIPQIRKKLRALHDGNDEDFETFLKVYYFDLHYQPLPNATPTNLRLGNLWRLSVDHPGQEVLPCVHRAPVEHEGEYRLLLIC